VTGRRGDTRLDDARQYDSRQDDTNCELKTISDTSAI
jgi:hypothetical protein